MNTRSILRCTLAAASLVGLLTAPASGQVERHDALPDGVARRLVDFYNAPETVRLTGQLRLPEGAEVSGNVAVLDGSLALAGRIRGELAVLNGDLTLEPGARVDGPLTVVGGQLLGIENADVGRAVVYRERLRYRLEGERLAYAPPRPPAPLHAGREVHGGRIDLTLASQGGYNRVEGLPIALGPRYLIRGSNPTRVEALLLYRTAASWPRSRRDVGHAVRVEQFLGGQEAVQLRLAHRSEIVPIEPGGMSQLENSLATFIFHRDYLDYYAREGWSASFRVLPPGTRHSLGVEFRSDRHSTARIRDPWTLPFNGPDWRPQPGVAEGTLRSLALQLDHDSRSTTIDPYSGWLARVEVEIGVGGHLADPAGQPTGGRLEEFASWTVDVRRYARLGPRSRASLRVLAGGPFGNGPLPPQRQHALGGVGSLPAYDVLEFDCGARDVPVGNDGARTFAFYGCDRVALVQLEYQSAFPFARGLVRNLRGYLDLGDTPGWVAFFNAGRAWTDRTSAIGPRDTGLDDFIADAGLGVRFGRFGIYSAVPLSGGGRGLHFFMRAGQRL